MRNKYKCVFSAKLKEQYPYLEKIKSESDVRCKKCNKEFSIASGCNSDIVRHLKSNVHRQALNAASGSQAINAFFSSTFDATMAAMEGSWAYHIINSNHSFQSSDCATKIFRTCFKLQKFSCSQTKCQSIVVNVFAPQVKQMLEEELKQCSYVSVYTDASNHGNVKLFPVLVRYFIPTVGVHVKVLDITSERGETSEIIHELISAAAAKYDLKNKIVAFCADNAKANFGGITRGGQNNVYYRMKSWLPHLIGIGCVAHIAHNALKYACDVLPFDVECVIVKIYAYFYIHTTHVTELVQFCETAGVEYIKLLGYAKTRFLALGPAIKRMLQLYDALKLLFVSLPKGEKMLKNFFSDPMSKCWLHFAQEQAELFAEYVLRIEGDDVTAIDITQYLDELQTSLQLRREDVFLSPKTAAEKIALTNDGYNAEILTANCSEFFDDAVEYLEKWAAPIMELKAYSWATLRRVPSWKDVEAVMQKLDTQKLYDANENARKLHNQLIYVKNYCSDSKLKQWKDDKVTTTNRWVELFKHLDSESCEYKEIAKIVEYILCMPGSTASVERVFAAMNKTWTKEKSQLKVDTLTAILTVKVNLKMSCMEFFEFIKSKPDMLRQISAKEKYNLRSADANVETDDDFDIDLEDDDDY